MRSLHYNTYPSLLEKQTPIIRSLSMQRKWDLHLRCQNNEPENEPDSIISRVTIAGVRTPCPSRPKNVLSALGDAHENPPPYSIKLTSSLARQIPSESLCKRASTEQVNTLKPLTTQAVLYGYLQKVGFAESFNSSSQDYSSYSYQTVLGNPGIIIGVF